MELSLDISYNQILRLVRQLPRKDIVKLANALQSEISTAKPVESIQNLILQAPTWTDSDLKDYNQARIHINKSRIA
jgi:hypothetical protein